MGQFSWLDCKTGEQVLDDVERDVYVLIPQQFGGGHILETCYDGYGHFGGHDIYGLVADWNKDHLAVMFDNEDTWKCGKDWIERYREDFYRLERGEELHCEKRDLGITLACYDEDNVRLRFPIKITHDPDAVYEYCAPSMGDPNQGWKCSDYDDDDEWY